MSVDDMNPCKNCTRVFSPDACENKNCPDWKAWWIPRWEQTCLTILRLLNKQEKANENRPD